MFIFRKLVVTILCVVCLGSASATTYNVNSFGATFVDDTVYANIGDTISFTIGIGHDAREITQTSYTTNVFASFPGGFNYPAGNFDFIVDSVKTYYYGCSFHLTSDQMKGVIISTGLSTPTYENDNKIYFYPNPFSTFLTVLVEDNSVSKTFSIIDAVGNIVYVDLINNTNKTIDLTFLKTGIYFVAIQTKEKRFTKVIIKN